MNDETSSGCVLFADVSGSTDFCDTVGDSAGQQAIDLCMKLCTALTEQHGGRVVKAADDEVMAIFPDASAAGSAARDIQLAAHDMAPVERARLGVRIGMHFGPVDERDGDVFGDTVNMAARLDAGERLRLVYRTRVVTLAAGEGSVVLGRDSAADVVVAERKASREHCEITAREGEFVLKDRSQNGTFLSIDGDREVVLRGDQTILRGHGFIALGQSRSTAAEFVEFFCE